MAEPKSKFENTSGGQAGAVILNAEGKPVGVAVGPGESIWLSEHEQALTANAPRHEGDNPFTNGTFTIKVKSSELPSSRPIGDHQDVESPPEPPAEPEQEMEEVRVEVPGHQDGEPEPEETAAAPTPEGPAPEGQRAAGEEVATPEAVPQDDVGAEAAKAAEDTPSAVTRKSTSPLAGKPPAPAPVPNQHPEDRVESE